MHLFVAIPCYDGKVFAATADALLGELLYAIRAGHTFEVARLEGCSSIPSARNALTRQFLESTADKLVFIDGDIAWPPGSLMDMCSIPHEIVGGSYRLKNESGDFVVHWLEGEAPLWTDKHGTFPVAGLGTGFLCITREALLKIREAMPDRVYRDNGKEHYAYFDMPYADGTLWGEDLRFCAMARACGIEIRCAPEILLSHYAGPNTWYSGRLGDWLRERMRQAA
jgi:hypothetical protein